MQVTRSPFEGVQTKTGLLFPTGTPFTIHCKNGKVPLFESVAVNVTAVPEHTGLLFGETEIEGIKTGKTVTFNTPGDVAVA